jgi:putative ABC transport system permease protein
MNIMLVAFLFSALVGVVFGYFSTSRSARQNPIEVLCYE